MIRRYVARRTVDEQSPACAGLCVFGYSALRPLRSFLDATAMAALHKIPDTRSPDRAESSGRGSKNAPDNCLDDNGGIVRQPS